MSFSQVVRNEIEEERHLHLDLKNYCYICVQMKYSTQLACSTSYHDHLKREIITCSYMRVKAMT